MLCEKFEKLSIIEKRELIGKMTHLVQTYEWAFNFAEWMVQKSTEEGLFEGIEISPEEKPPTNSL